MNEKERRKHNSNGIFTVTQLSYTFRPRKQTKRRKSKTTKYYHSLKALAIREKKIYVVGKPDLIVTGTPVYLDVEGIPEQDFYYLIGLRFTKDGSLCRYSFWADDLSQEKEMWHDCEKILSGVDNPKLIYYGSYETRFLKQMKRRYAASTHEEETLDHLIEVSRNLLSVIYGQVYFPTYSNGLKDIAVFLGFKWSTEDPSGVRSLLWRSKWEVTKDATWKHNLLTYNAEDCEAVQKIAEAISAIIPENATPESASTSTNIVHADALKRQRLYQWGKTDFSLPEFDFINRCAYWDYQRDRLHVRSNASHKRGGRATGKRAIVTYPVNKTIEPFCPTQCPQCGSPRIRRYGRHTKPLYDVKFGRAGVKRWVQRYVVQHYRCAHCGKTFPSDRHGTTRHLYGPELLAYVVYHVIDLAIPQAVLARQINTVFHYDVGQPTINVLKKRAAEFYLETYDAINCKIVGGDLVHVDETKTSIKGERAYVWVFTSLEEVLYVYSETREATVVEKRLEGFKGVLVSDFYAAYESIDCPQQKCLVHLIRDLNDDLLKHPFNEELRSLGHDFARTLKPMVETIDRFGLMKRFLRKHKADAQRFLSNISHCDYETEIATAYQKRFKKNADRLFTFLNYDGVAWHNNNAEHAIKAFARLRVVIGGSCNERGIRDYLILLSVSETCKYKGVRFLDFLRSGEKDIDGFARRKGSRRRVANHAVVSPVKRHLSREKSIP
jgi:transposase-like protein